MKYIKTDYENGLKQIKVALMNALNSNEDYEFKYISWKLLLDCVKELEWEISYAYSNSIPSGTFIEFINNEGNKVICSQDPRYDGVTIKHYEVN